MGEFVRIESGAVQLDVTGLASDGSVRHPRGDASILLDQGGQIRVQASGFTPEGKVDVWGFSTPVLLGSDAVDGQGRFDRTFTLPRSMGGGHHTLQINGPSQDGNRSISLGLLIDGSGVPVWQATDHPKAVIATQVAFFALSGVAALGGLSAAAGAAGMAGMGAGAGAGLGAAARGAAAGAAGGAAAGRSENEGKEHRRKAGKVASVKVKAATLADSSHARGDLSRSWRLPGRVSTDRLGVTLPGRLNRFSPLAARLVSDGMHLRAMFGSLWAVLVAGAGAAGVMAGLSVQALPAPTVVPAAIALVLGTLDAFAGAAAAIAFMSTLLATGAIDSTDGLRGALGVAALWFALPMLAGETRPLRRPAARTTVERWYRAGDFVVLPALGAWLTLKLVKALPGLFGHSIDLADYAGRIALVAGAAILGRLLLEEIATWLYPVRLTEVSAPALGSTSMRQKLGAIAVKTGFFLFVALPFVGLRPELFVGAVLFALPQLLKLWDKRIPKRSWLYRLMPRGIVKVTALVVIGFYLGQYIAEHITNTAKLAATGFVVMAIPPAAIGLLTLFGKEPASGRSSWLQRAIGAVTVVTAGIVVYQLSVA
jgi:hypothetical protein